MKLLPWAIKIILNIIFYIIYYLIFWILLGLFFDKVMWIHYSNNDPMVTKIWFVVLIFVLIITFIFRKFFYISLKNN